MVLINLQPRQSGKTTYLINYANNTIKIENVVFLTYFELQKKYIKEHLDKTIRIYTNNDLMSENNIIRCDTLFIDDYYQLPLHTRRMLFTWYKNNYFKNVIISSTLTSFGIFDKEKLYRVKTIKKYLHQFPLLVNDVIETLDDDEKDYYFDFITEDDSHIYYMQPVFKIKNNKDLFNKKYFEVEMQGKIFKD